MKGEKRSKMSCATTAGIGSCGEKGGKRFPENVLGKIVG